MTGLPSIAPYRLPTGAELPRNTVSWKIEPERAVLLIHDMQRYFLAPFDAAVRDELVGRVAGLRRQLARHGARIAYTAQPGGMSERERGLLRDFWGPGMRTEPADREIVPELAPAAGDWQLTKWRYSAFVRSNLAESMRVHGRDQLVLCGVYANVGILATALDAYARDVQAFVVGDAVADFSAAEHRQALDYVARRCGRVLAAGEVFA